MKLFILTVFLCSILDPVLSEGHKKYKKEDFKTIKTMKIEYLNKRLICVNNSQNFKQLKKCWRDKKQKIN